MPVRSKEPMSWCERRCVAEANAVAGRTRVINPSPSVICMPCLFHYLPTFKTF
jgi:hypothetical protein